MARSIKHIKDLTTCPICKEQFEDPRGLPCIHTYCLKCIQKYGKDAQPGDEIHCPVCRKPVRVPEGGLVELPQHFLIHNLLDSVTVDLSAKCSDCIFRSATKRCNKCEEHFCERCILHHRLHSGHLSNLSNYSSVLCKVHETQLKIYCFDCNVTVCFQCYQDGHYHHKCADIDAVLHKQRIQLTQRVDQVRHSTEELKEQKKKLNDNKKDFTKQLIKSVDEIKDIMVQKKQAIDAWGKSLVSYVETQCDEHNEIMKQLNSTISQRVTDMDHFMTYANQLASAQSHLAIEKEAPSLSARADELLQQGDIEHSLNAAVNERAETLKTIREMIDSDFDLDRISPVPTTAHSTYATQHATDIDSSMEQRPRKTSTASITPRVTPTSTPEGCKLPASSAQQLPAISSRRSEMPRSLSQSALRRRLPTENSLLQSSTPPSPVAAVNENLRLSKTSYQSKSLPRLSPVEKSTQTAENVHSLTSDVRMPLKLPEEVHPPQKTDVQLSSQASAPETRPSAVETTRDVNSSAHSQRRQLYNGNEQKVSMQWPVSPARETEKGTPSNSALLRKPDQQTTPTEITKPNKPGEAADSLRTGTSTEIDRSRTLSSTDASSSTVAATGKKLVVSGTQKLSAETSKPVPAAFASSQTPVPKDHTLLAKAIPATAPDQGRIEAVRNYHSDNKKNGKESTLRLADMSTELPNPSRTAYVESRMPDTINEKSNLRASAEEEYLSVGERIRKFQPILQKREATETNKDDTARSEATNLSVGEPEAKRTHRPATAVRSSTLSYPTEETSMGKVAKSSTLRTSEGTSRASTTTIPPSSMPPSIEKQPDVAASELLPRTTADLPRSPPSTTTKKKPAVPTPPKRLSKTQKAGTAIGMPSVPETSSTLLSSVREIGVTPMVATNDSNSPVAASTPVTSHETISADNSHSTNTSFEKLTLPNAKSAESSPHRTTGDEFALEASTAEMESSTRPTMAGCSETYPKQVQETEVVTHDVHETTSLPVPTTKVEKSNTASVVEQFDFLSSAAEETAFQTLDQKSSLLTPVVATTLRYAETTTHKANTRSGGQVKPGDVGSSSPRTAEDLPCLASLTSAVKKKPPVPLPRHKQPSTRNIASPPTRISSLSSPPEEGIIQPTILTTNLSGSAETYDSSLPSHVHESSLGQFGSRSRPLTGSNTLPRSKENTKQPMVTTKKARAQTAEDLPYSRPTGQPAVRTSHNSLEAAFIGRKVNEVTGITLVDDRVYVVYCNSKTVEVYSSEPVELRSAFEVSDISHSPSGIAACSRNMCLYISDWKNSSVHRIALASMVATKVWTVAKKPRGLSVNSASNLLVTCTDEHRLQEYSTKGEQLRDICLKACVESPWHAVQLPSGKYAVSQSIQPGAVTLLELDEKGVKRHAAQSTPFVGELSTRSLAVTGDNDVLVADRFSNRIVAMSTVASRAQVLDLSVDGGLQQPVALCWDEARRRLYVGEWKERRLLVFDNVQLTWQSKVTRQPITFRRVSEQVLGKL